jgi:hypothetical protein
VLVDRLEQRQQTILGQLAATEGRLDEVSSAITDAGVVVVGSKGQPIPNRLLSVERILRRDQAQLERELIKVEHQLDECRRLGRINAVFAGRG